MDERPTLNGVLRCSTALRYLPQSCDHRPGCCDPGISIGGVLGHYQHPKRLPHLPPRTVVVVATPTTIAATPTIIAATPSLVAATPGATTPRVRSPRSLTASLFPEIALLQLFLRGQSEDGIGGLVMGPFARPSQRQGSGRVFSVRRKTH